MIKFFRQFRRHFLQKNNVSKYFLYAIGEIILVVIGILIALQINSWNQKRIEAKEEQKILKNLKVDFDNNEELLESIILETKNGINSCLYMLSFTGDKRKPDTSKEFDSVLNGVFVSPAFYPINGTLDEITNSGKLGIIKNEELRKILSTWKPIINRTTERYEATNDYENYLNQFMLVNGNWLNADQVSHEKRSMTMPLSGFSTDNRSLLEYQHFENLIENIAIGLDNYLKELNEASRILGRIQTLIRSEIDPD